ncbi:MAG: glycosyltransferase [Pseudomonadota bacterium]
MKVLTLTTLYPHAETPTHGVFVENRMRDFVRVTDADVEIIAPVPWFPFSAKAFGHYSKYASVPEAETRFGLNIRHPRYFTVPKVGMTYASLSLANCFLKSALRSQRQNGEFDIIDAHYLYPDGVAAVHAATRLKKPVVLTARGSDVSLIMRYPRQRAMILDAIYRADAVVCVAKALRDKLIEYGAPAEKIIVLRNGVDLDEFRPADSQSARKHFDISGKAVAVVGHLIDRKSPQLVLDALVGRADTTVLFAGDGPLRRSLEQFAEANNIDVRFLGIVPHCELVKVYNAVDCLALASDREGWPNVLLEALACGTPVVATPVWGNCEIVTHPDAGVLSASRDVADFRTALNEVLDDPLPLEEKQRRARQFAEKYSWHDTSIGLKNLFSDIITTHKKSAQILQRKAGFRSTNKRSKLIITIDTEEAFDWCSFNNPEWRVCSPSDIDHFQSLCEELHAKPLYFLTYPLLTDEKTSTYFKHLHDNNKADCGLHLHQWCTPPIGESSRFQGTYYSWQSNITQAAHLEKLQSLVRQFKSVFSERPLSHRAGRYGISLSAYQALADVGIRYDFSPSPAFDFSNKGGPNFKQMSNTPFYVHPANRQDIAVFPAVGARAIKGGTVFLPQRGPMGVSSDIPLELRKRIWTLPSVTAPMRLSPEGASLNDLKGLARSLVQNGTPILPLSLHSTTLTPGANQYGQSAIDVEAFLEKTRAFLGFFKNELGDIISFGELQNILTDSKQSHAPVVKTDKATSQPLTTS